MTRQLPPPIDGTQAYLAAIHDRLGELLDRLPKPPERKAEGGQVELREPVQPAAPQVEVTEPKRPTGTKTGPGATRRPARQPRTTTKKET